VDTHSKFTNDKAEHNSEHTFEEIRFSVPVPPHGGVNVIVLETKVSHVTRVIPHQLRALVHPVHVPCRETKSQFNGRKRVRKVYRKKNVLPFTFQCIEASRVL